MNITVVKIKTCSTRDNYKTIAMNEVKVKVRGMNCKHCKINVENGLQKVPGIDVALADIVNGEVTLKGDKINLDNVKTTIESLGYFYDGETR